MRKRRGHEELEPEHSGKRQLAQLDTGTRASVLEELQRAGGNSALQQVVAGAQLQRDTARPSRGHARMGEWLLSVNGAVVGRARSVAGGSIRSDVITEGGSGDVQHKRIANPEYEPVVLEVGLGMSTGFADWIGSVFDRRDLRRSLTLHHVDGATGAEHTRLELNEALVTAVEVPQLAAADTNPAWLKVTVAAEEIRRSAGTGVKLDTKAAADPIVPSTTRLEVSGIGRVSELKSVAPWNLKQATTSTPRGEHAQTKLDFGNLVLTLAEGAKGGGAGISAFDAWVEDTLVSGNTGKGSERTAVLTVTSQGGRKLELSFSGVGIYSADQLARSEAGDRRYGLYVEGATLRLS